MKKIALFISSLQKGGSERVMANLAEYFYGKQYDVVLVTQYKQDVEYEINPNIRRVYSEPSADKLTQNRIHNFYMRFSTLRSIWKTEKPDVILAFLGKNNLMAIATSRFLPNKVVVSVRGEPTMEYPTKVMQKIAKTVFAFADGIVLQTNVAKAFFPENVQKKSVILPNPLNTDFVKHRYEGEREDFIVTVGRLDENKNQAMMIHGFAKIADEFPTVKLVIYGEGNKREELERLVKEKGLEERILLPGYITDVVSYIERAKCFLLTSNTEGMPNSIMEAMALGIPVIATDCPCGGAATLIQSGENGILIPVGDAYALADALRKVLTDREFAQKLSDRAYESSQMFHPAKVNRIWEKYLHTVTKQ